MARKPIIDDHDETTGDNETFDSREYGLVSFEMDVEADDHPRSHQLAKQLEIDFINKDL